MTTKTHTHELAACTARLAGLMVECPCIEDSQEPSIRCDRCWEAYQTNAPMHPNNCEHCNGTGRVPDPRFEVFREGCFDHNVEEMTGICFQCMEGGEYVAQTPHLEEVLFLVGELPLTTETEEVSELLRNFVTFKLVVSEPKEYVEAALAALCESVE